MRESHTSGSVQGVPGNRHPYCDRASHQTALTIFHLCTSFRTLSLTYAMMGSRTSMEPKHQVRRTQGRFPAGREQ
jgi:hypothetical protein